MTAEGAEGRAARGVGAYHRACHAVRAKLQTSSGKLFEAPTLRRAPAWERILSLRPVSLLPHHEAIEGFEDASRKLRERFMSSVLEALPGVARRLFEQEWQESADLMNIESIRPLAVSYLMSCERCVFDLLNKNYDGLASAHFEKCVSVAANNIRTKVIASRSQGGDIVSFPGNPTAERSAECHWLTVENAASQMG